MQTAGIYARVSTDEQTCENQLLELRRFAEARGWRVVEYVDTGISGATTSRPALDRLLKDARRRKLDVVLAWSLDRVGRSLRHLVGLLDDLHALNVGFVSLREGLDWTTPSGRLQAQLLACIAEFERARLAERVKAGLQRARRQGTRLGRPRRGISSYDLASVEGLSLRGAAKHLGISKSIIQRARVSRKPTEKTAA